MFLWPSITACLQRFPASESVSAPGAKRQFPFRFNPVATNTIHIPEIALFVSQPRQLMTEAALVCETNLLRIIFNNEIFYIFARYTKYDGHIRNILAGKFLLELTIVPRKGVGHVVTSSPREKEEASGISPQGGIYACGNRQQICHRLQCRRGWDTFLSFSSGILSSANARIQRAVYSFHPQFPNI